MRRDREPAARDPYRRQGWERVAPRDEGLGAPRDRWQRRDRWERRERAAPRHADSAPAPRDRRREDRRAAREDHRAVADARDRRHVNRYDQDRGDRRAHHGSDRNHRTDRNDRKRCNVAQLPHDATREERRRAKRDC